MAYNALTFVAGEVPTASKWNKLWENDASFNDGTGIANLSLAVTALANPYKFRARPSANQTGVTHATWTQITLATEDFDTNNNFASSAYIVPVSGYYQFNANLWLVGAAGTYQGVGVRIWNNTTSAELAAHGYSFDNNTSFDYMKSSASCLVYVAAGDVIQMQGIGLVSSGTVGFAATSTSFSGFLVSKT